jgi:glycosyltransferase involved in cell wall biosynthesis
VKPLRELVVVMPVYNESACIAGVLKSWMRELDGLGVDYRILVLNDGSRDDTAEILQQFASDPRLEIVHKANEGHGPTVLQGYRRAVEEGAWVFQCDSDDEMQAGSFVKLWRQKTDADAVFAVRMGRRQGAARWLITRMSRWTVRMLFRGGVADVNVPFRLMRAAWLKRAIAGLPDRTFAPNVIVSGRLAQAGAHLVNVPVPHRMRRTGSVSIVKWRLWRGAAESWWQTVQAARVPHGKR